MIPGRRPWEEAAGFHIGLRSIPASDWLEGGEADPATRKDALWASHRAQVWGELPGSEPGQAECQAMIDAALGGAAGQAADQPALWAAARRVSDDLCLMEKRDGAWRLTALSLCAGSFFTAEQALGKDLTVLHAPVPGFGEEMLPRVERMFDALRPDLVLERHNWTLSNSADLFVPDPAAIRARIADIDPAQAGRELTLRVERQTLRRLPQTGGVLFTIRIWLTPLERLAEDPATLQSFATAWREAPAPFRAYKRLDLYDALVEAFLRQHAALDPAQD